MSSRQTNLRASSPHGGELSLQTTTTDSPVLPIAQLEQLRQIAPHRIDWVFDETSKEAEFRRNEVRRVNTLTFATHMATLTMALAAVAAGIGAAMYCASIDQTAVAVTFATTTIGGLAWAFMSSARRHSDDKPAKRPK